MIRRRISGNFNIRVRNKLGTETPLEVNALRKQ